MGQIVLTEEQFNQVKAIVVRVMRDEDERGGPMQREYPRAVVDSMANSIAAAIGDYLAEGGV
jgi:hypothetical protein